MKRLLCLLSCLAWQTSAWREVHLPGDAQAEGHDLMSLDKYDTIRAFASTNGPGGPTLSGAQGFVKEFSAQVAEPATYFYHLFQPNANDSTALAYTVTQLASTSFYQYLFDKSNAAHVQVSPLSNDNLIPIKTYVPPARKRSGAGAVFVDIKYGGWKVVWRGVEMDIYILNWEEQGYIRKRQTHIIVRTMPSILSLPLWSDGHATAGMDGTDINPDRAASLFLLEVGQTAAQVNDAVLVFDQGYWDMDKLLWQSVQKSSWDDVILDEESKAALKHEYRSFYASEEMYKSLGVAWKRGVIFHGPPGNGKTISLKAMMKDVKVPLLYVKSFHTYGGDELGIRLVFERARQEAPCLLILEDADSLITNANKAFFLNEVDGIEDNDGLLLIGSTNHLDRLDPALSNRPSRFDRKYYFGNPSRDERVAYALYWRNKVSNNSRIDYPMELAEDVADRTEKFSFAYLKEAFVSALLRIAGDESKTLRFGDVLLKQIDVLKRELHDSPPPQAANISTGRAASRGSGLRLQPAVGV